MKEKKIKLNGKEKSVIKMFSKTVKNMTKNTIKNIPMLELQLLHRVITEEMHNREHTVTIEIESERFYNWKRTKRAYVAIMRDNQLSFCSNVIRLPNGANTEFSKFKVDCQYGDILQCRLSSKSNRPREFYIVGKDKELIEITNMRVHDELYPLSNEERVLMLNHDDIINDINSNVFCPFCNHSMSSLAKKCTNCNSTIDKSMTEGNMDFIDSHNKTWENDGELC